ncbi:MAG: hypothetical protein SGCHY_002032 [Lobulomycetales sp.]
MHSGGSSKASISVDETSSAQDTLIDYMRMHDGEYNDNLDEYVVSELLNLAMASDKLNPEAREDMRRKPLDQKLKYIRYIHSGLRVQFTSGIASHHESQSESVRKTPQDYLEYINNATRDVVKSFNKTRSSAAFGAVVNLSRTLSQRFHSSTSSTSAKSGFNELKEVIIQLKIDCSLQSTSWLFRFIEIGGLKALFGLLDVTHKKPEKKHKHHEVEAEVLKVMKIIANHDRGIEDILAHPSSLNILIHSLNSPNLPTRTNSLDFLLGVVTIEYPLGHRLVTDAFSYLMSTLPSAKYIFTPLIEAILQCISQQGILGTRVGARARRLHQQEHGGEILFAAESGAEKKGDSLYRDVKEFLISGMALVRYIIEVPDELEYRIYLRNKMMCSGLGNVLASFKTWATSEFESIFVHIHSIEHEARADTDEFVNSLSGSYQSRGVDLSNPQQSLEAILTCLENDSVGTESLKSIMQQLLIPARLTDGHLRSNYFILVEHLISQIVLDQNGISSDFSETFKESVELALATIKDKTMHNMANKGENEGLRNTLHQLELETRLLRQGQETLQYTEEMNQKMLQKKEKQIELLASQLEEVKKNHEDVVKKSQADMDEILSKLKNSGESLRLDTRMDSKIAMSAAESEVSLQVEGVSSAPPVSAPTLAPPPPAPPAPAPPGALAGPPPPPPPPGAPPPPPAPGGAPLVTGPKLKYTPQKKLRKLQWDKVSPSILNDSIWKSKKIDTASFEHIVHEKGLFDKIESVFALAKPNQGQNGTLGTGMNKPGSIQKPGSAALEKSRKVEIIESKRAQNIMIMLGRLKKYSCVELRQAVLRLDSSIVTEHVARQFIANAPTSDEAKLLEKYGSDSGTGKLRLAEEFLLEMSRIDGFIPRLEGHVFKLTYYERLKGIDKGITRFSRALEALSGAQHLPKLLNLILTVGNYLNSSSGNSSALAHGFRISSLNRLGMMKSADGKTTLLAFLVSAVEQQFPEYLEFLQEIRPVLDVSNASSVVIKEELDELRRSLKKLEFEISRQESTQETAQDTTKDCFQSVMIPFQQKCRTEIKSLDGLWTRMQESYVCVARLYAEEQDTPGRSMKIEEFCRIFKVFADAFQTELATYRRKQQRQKQTMSTCLKFDGAGVQTASSEAIPGSSGLRMEKLDNLLESLKSGAHPNALGRRNWNANTAAAVPVDSAKP